MTIQEAFTCLYDKATKEAYTKLLFLEHISEQEDCLYPYVNEFIKMLNNVQPAIRVRGFRLLCKQAKWDHSHIIDQHITIILDTLSDTKPTVTRQKLHYLEELILYKKALLDQIKQAVLHVDQAKYPETMRPLIEKDKLHIIKMIDET